MGEGWHGFQCLFHLCHSPSISMYSLTQNLSESQCSRVFIELTLQLPISHLGRLVGRAESPNLFSHLVFLVTSAIMRLSRGSTLSHFIGTDSAVIKRGLSANSRRYSCHAENSKGFGSSARNQGKRLNIFLFCTKGVSTD